MYHDECCLRFYLPDYLKKNEIKCHLSTLLCRCYTTFGVVKNMLMSLKRLFLRHDILECALLPVAHCTLHCSLCCCSLWPMCFILQHSIWLLTLLQSVFLNRPSAQVDLTVRSNGGPQKRKGQDFSVHWFLWR